jgi:Uroporphyrinogen decarboxylase (URO-D)
MTPRERFLACNRFQSVDHVPFVEIAMWGQTVERWRQEGMPREVDTSFYMNGNEFFGFERWEYLPLNVGLIPGFDYEVLEEDERIIVFRGGEGITHRALKEGTVGGTRLSMDQYLSFPVTDRASFHDMARRYDPHTPLRYPRWWEDAVRCYRGRDYPLALTGIGGFGLFSMLRWWMGTERTCTSFYDDPALVEEMLDFLTDFFIELTERALTEVKIDWYNYFEDFAFKTGPLVSPALYKRFLLPRYQRLNEHLRRHGVQIISLDSDGNIEVLLPLVLEAGFNHLCPLEQAAGMDLIRLRREYGQAFALLGGIDKRELAKGRREIERELQRQAPFLLETGGYIPTVDHAIPPDVSYDNFRYYLDLKRQLLEGQ